MELEYWTFVIGGAILVGVIGYTWASSRHAAQRRRNIDRGGNIDSREFIDQMLQGEAAKLNAANSAKAGIKKGSARRQEPKISPGADQSANADSVQATEPKGPRQGSLINNNNETLAKQEAPQDSGTSPTPGHQPELVLVYVMARGGGEFRCSGVNRMLTRAGCLLDERGVFHLKDEDQKANFSVVNALEPATFDRERMDVTNTRGLAFFFETRGSDDRRRFDSMMNTARRLSVELDGELLDEKREPVSSAREQRYRSDLAD